MNDKMMLTLQDLQILAATAERNGTSRNFPEVAIQWAAGAQAEIEKLRGERGVLVRLLVQCDGVLSTLEGESTDEQEMLDSLRRAIRNATTPHRSAEADLLAVSERLGA